MQQVIFTRDGQVGPYPEAGEDLKPLVAFDPRNPESMQAARHALQTRFGWQNAPVLSGGNDRSAFSDLWLSLRRVLSL